MSDEPTKGKIHIDSDWKQEAEKEKERLAAEEAQEKDKSGGLPKPTVADLLNVIAMPALMSLGGYRTPDGQVIPPDLGASRFHIDMLELLEEKTKGNLTEEESRQLGGLLHQLRTSFTAVVSEMGKAGGDPEAKA